jgi:hypothetical protein
MCVCVCVREREREREMCFMNKNRDSTPFSEFLGFLSPICHVAVTTKNYCKISS